MTSRNFSLVVVVTLVSKGLKLFHHGDFTRPNLVRTLALFVGPVGRDSVLRGFVHGSAAKLNFQRAAAFGQNSGVKTLVAVAFRPGDVVLEPAFEGHPQLMNNAEHHIAGVGGLTYDAQTHQIVDLFQRLAPVLHLAVNGVEVFGPGVHLNLDPRLGRRLEQLSLDLVQILAALLFLEHDMFADLGVEVGLEVF